MNEEKFYAEAEGLTKLQVIEMITENMNDGIAPFIDLRDPDINKLSDSMMREFVNQYWYASTGSNEWGEDVASRSADNILASLAAKIQKDG